jgi:hypothetical protein
VGEHDLARRQRIFGDRDAAVAEIGFETVLFEVVAYGEAGAGSGMGAV